MNWQLVPIFYFKYLNKGIFKGRRFLLFHLFVVIVHNLIELATMDRFLIQTETKQIASPFPMNQEADPNYNEAIPQFYDDFVANVHSPLDKENEDPNSKAHGFTSSVTFEDRKYCFQQLGKNTPSEQTGYYRCCKWRTKCPARIIVRNCSNGKSKIEANGKEHSCNYTAIGHLEPQEVEGIADLNFVMREHARNLATADSSASPYDIALETLNHFTKIYAGNVLITLTP
jgi:hypothetical protein